MPRTRSESAHQKVIHAAVELVAERGIDASSMDAIAAKAGVSKATIYKHWSDKEALMLEMMATICALDSRPKFDSGNTRADIIAVLAYRPKEDPAVRDRIVPQFVAYSATHAEFGQAWRARVMEPPRRELRHLIEKSAAKGELRIDLDIDLCLAILLGPAIYWHIFIGKKAHDRKPLAEAIVEVFWRAFAKK